MQKKPQHGALDELTNTLDYTFIDLPDLVDASLEGEMFQAPEDNVQHAMQPSLQHQHQQQHAGAFEQYLSMPFWQQLQHGSHQQHPQPAVGPLGQALAAGLQSSQAAEHSMQPQHQSMQQKASMPAAYQQQQQQYSQHWPESAAAQQRAQASVQGPSGTGHQAAAASAAAGPGQHVRQQHCEADMDEG